VWPRYTLNYKDANKKDATLDLALTFVDFAASEGRFRKHFRNVPEDKWSDQMVQVDEFLELDTDEQETAIPFIWTVNKKQQLIRTQVTKELASSALERRNFWRQLRSLSGYDHKLDKETLVKQTRQQMAQSLTSNLLSMTGGDVNTAAAGDLLSSAGNASAASNSAAPAGDYEPVWVDSPECTACDDCIDINPDIFTYNEDKLVVIKNPQAGTFKEIVKAAEQCTAECIHPGSPFNPNEDGLDKLIKRAEKFQ
jgi:pyruvate-ferredoxin/flavodoxin oxidoreductase